MQHRLSVATTILITSLLSACGGGGGGNDGISNGNFAKDVNHGAITGFGSVFVNGARFDTDNAQITAEDTPLNSVNELRVGMMVTVTSNAASSVATSVSYREDVHGPLDTDVSNFDGAFTVMGQTVVVDASTVIDNSLSLPLNAGDIVAVSGMRQADDSILATFIEDKPRSSTPKYKVIGAARSVDILAKTFLIGDLLVDYSAANLSEFPGGNPAEGQLVEVKNEAAGYVAGSLHFLASKVRPIQRIDNTAGGNIHLESVVTQVIEPAVQFSVPGFTVNVLASTAFRFGSAADIGVGTVLQIEGKINTDGEIDARKITFKKNSARLQGTVDINGVDPANNRVTVFGVTVQVTSMTRIRDKRDRLSPFSVTNIADGDFLEIRGYTSADGNTLIATRLERNTNKGKNELRGIATNVDTVAQQLDILGITVTAGANTNFEGAGESPTSATAFFDAITSGLSVVKAKWDKFNDINSPPKVVGLEDDFSNGRLGND